MRALLGLALLATLQAPSTSIKEPKTGVTFDTKIGDMCLLGVGVRTKTFLKFKVYALGLYVSDSALSGPLAVHRGKVGTSAFYNDLIGGDFEKQFVLKIVRDLSTKQIRDAFRSYMPEADPQLVTQFVSYFGEAKSGQVCIMRWVPGGRLETTVAGVPKQPIHNKAFADAVFAIWLRDRRSVDPIRSPLVSRAEALLK